MPLNGLWPPRASNCSTAGHEGTGVRGLGWRGSISPISRKPDGPSAWDQRRRPRPVFSVLTRDDHRNTGSMHHRGADRSEEHPFITTAAVTAHDNDLSRLGLLEQVAGRAFPDDSAVDPDFGIALLPTRQPLREHGFRRR